MTLPKEEMRNLDVDNLTIVKGQKEDYFAQTYPSRPQLFFH